MAEPSMNPIWRPTAVVAALAFTGYLGVAWGVENLYPFSTFPMYSGAHTATASRVVARDGSGRLHEVEDYDAWTCDLPLRFEVSRCGDVYHIPYVDLARREYIDGHRAPGQGDPRGEPVDVVRHVWRFSGPGEPLVEDCLLHRCRAVPR
jgi:hypothetical protein